MCERLQPERCVLVANNPAVLPALQEAAASLDVGHVGAAA